VVRWRPEQAVRVTAAHPLLTLRHGLKRHRRVVAQEGDGGIVDLWDMNTQNEFGKDAGRYVYAPTRPAPAARSRSPT
jgi:hypothetical protein